MNLTFRSKHNNMKKYLLIVLTIISIMPVLGFAQGQEVKLDYSGFVKCDGVLSTDPKTGKLLPGEEKRDRVCDFNALMLTIKLGINWLFIITIPVATVALAYGGLMYMTGQKGKIDQAKKIFSSIAMGFIIMATAWFAVTTVVNWFINPINVPVVNTFLNTGK